MNNKLVKAQGLTAFAVAVFAFFVVQLVVAIPMSAVEVDSFGYWLIMALVSIAVGVTSWICTKVLHVDYVSVTTVGVKPRLSHVAWGCAITVGLVAFMLPVNNWLFDLIERCGLARPSVDLPMNLVPLIVVGCVIPAVGEELLFRGVIGNKIIAGSNNKLLGCCIAGALFSLFHMNPAQTVHQFVLGAVFACICYRSGSVWTSVILHLFNNLLAVLLGFVLTDELVAQYSLWLLLGGAVVVSLGMWGYFATTSCNCCTFVEQEDSEQISQKESNLSSTYLMFWVAVGICLLAWVATLVE